MKTGKRIISLLLCAIMVFGMFSGVDFGIDFSIFNLKSSAADINLGGITQTRVVSNYESLYKSYQDRFFLGRDSNSPTNFVIPGLSSSNDYTPQGMTYWEEKEWILISAYDASGAGKHSVIYALDAVTTEFVALFKILNANGSVNTSHGGGIAASKYNFYYADTGSNISYFPLSELDVPNGTVKEVRLQGSINCGGELGGAATSYCCYEDGVLWAGNFYYDGDDRYKTSAHSSSNSMIVGYELHGNSSAEEWYYLSTNYNRIKLNNDSTADQTASAGGSTMTYKTFNVDGANAEIRGSIAYGGTPVGEICPSFASVTLTEGKKYKIEFISTNNLSDIYMFAPNGTHCNVKQSQQTTITPLANGKYHYQMVFTAGLKPAGADSSWPTTQSTNGSYTGTYSMRFDQDSITAARDFAMTDISITEYVEPKGFTPDSHYEGVGCAGNPTHVILFPGMDKFQYAMVYKGKIYISRSWKRESGTNHTRELMVGDLDINSPGDSNLVINGRTRPCHVLSLNKMTRFGGDNGNNGQNGAYNYLDKMFYMGEALCVMNDNLYMFGEGAAWAYNGKESSKCNEPIDVIWKIDQYAIMGETRLKEDVALSHYEKVNSLSEITDTDDYIIVFESTLKDPVTQKNIIYALDAFGGYGNNKLPKQDAGTQANSGDAMGIVGYPITTYSKDEDNGDLYITDEDDANRSIRWRITGTKTGQLRINNTDPFYSKNNHLYFGSRLFAMTTDARTNLDRIKIDEVGNGNFYFRYEGDTSYYLWCNDGRYQNYLDAYTNYYSNHGKSGYVPAYHGLEEVPGTFHADGLKGKPVNESGNIMDTPVDVALGEMQIYKRVPDEYADTYTTRVFTDLKAELQADGTYKIDLETYAISPTQYQKVDERPTDFIFVLDASGSMTNNNDATGYHTDLNNWSALKMNQACGDKSDSFFGEGDNYNTAHKSNFYYKFPDGEFGSIYVAFNKKDSSYTRDIWLWAEHPVSKRCYRLSKFGFMTHGNFSGGADWDQDSSYRITEANFLANQQNLGWANQAAVIADVKADKNRTDYHSSRNSTNKRANYEVMNYQYTNDYGDTRASYYSYGNCSRLLAMQNAVERLTYKIESESAKTGLAHRIAVVQFGSDSGESYLNNGMYTNAGASMVQYNGANSISAANYKNAFFNVSGFPTVRRIVNNIVTWNGDPDTYSNYGFEMANNIVSNSDANYLADGNRSACIIMITDGIPGIGNNADVAKQTANKAIAETRKSKDQGAYVYTVQMGNNSLGGFDMDAYMDYTSSEFIFAESLDNPGDRDINEVEYRIDVPTGSSLNLDNLVNKMFESITSNSENALAKLDADSVVREQISSAFDLSNADVTVNYADAAYDGLDRLYFEEPYVSGLKTPTINNNTVTVTGYDYSKHFVSPSTAKEGNAKKLVITFTGVTPNVNAELNNTNINNTNTTAIYQDASMMNQGKEFKLFPTEHFSLPEYTYILDFGVNMLDIDVNGTLQSVDYLPKKQTTYSTLLNDPVNSNAIIGFTQDKQDLLYSLQPGASADEAKSRGYVLIQRDDGTYDWFRINIVPASNVLFEENSASVSGSGVAWQTAGAALTGKYQSLTSSSDVYGYDNVYNGNIGDFSNGSAYNAVVSNNNNRSETLKFNYTGSAVDIVSACGPQTGIQVIAIKRQDGSIEKAYIIDTYYTDTAHLNSNNILSQVPIVHHENKDGHGTYTVEITAAYLSAMVNARPKTRSLYSANTVNFYTPDIKDMAAEALLTSIGMEELLDADIEVLFADENSVFNGGTGAAAPAVSTFALTRGADRDFSTLNNYFDGFRVYNSMGEATADYIESERGSMYFNVINSLATTDDYGNIISSSNSSLVAYVEGNTNETIEFANYANVDSKAPMNEVYLTADNSIGFNVRPGSQKIMISLRAVSGSPKAKIGGKEFEVKSSTEMYYDITDYVAADGTVTVQNTGSGLLAVCNIKVVNGGIMPVMMSALPRMRMMMAMPAEEVVPNQPPVDEPVINPDLMPDSPVENPDPDLDVEGSIPDYVPETDDSDDSIGLTFEAFINKIRSFIERVVEFFKSLYTVMGGK